MSVSVDDLLPMSQDLSDKLEAIMFKSGQLMQHRPVIDGKQASVQKVALGAVQQVVACCHQHGYPIDDFLKELIAAGKQDA